MNRATSPTGWVRNPDGTLGWTWNPMSGCRNHTPEGLCLGGLFPCYGYKLANGRVKPLYLHNLEIALPHENPKIAFDDPFYPRFWEDRLEEIWELAKGRHSKIRGIFPCDMGDMFGIGIPGQWTRDILEAISHAAPHRFYLLTKQPQRLPAFSPFPDNAWVGATCTSKGAINHTLPYLMKVGARVIYLSIEPFLKWDDGSAKITADRLLDAGINWLIIGACTGNYQEMAELRLRYPELSIKQFGRKWTAQPPIEWLREIIEAADKAGIKVFLKDNLKPLLAQVPAMFRNDDDLFKRIRVEQHPDIRQELPAAK